MNKKIVRFLAHIGMNMMDAVLIRCLFCPSNIKAVHISFDDVYKSFLDAVELNCISIFEVPFFSILKKFNTEYGAKFSLYIFEDEKVELNDSMLCELESCKSWLSIGYHGKRDSVCDVQSFRSFYSKFGGTGLVSKSCRLHGFMGNHMEIEELKKSGINELFCVDDGRTSYGIPSEIYKGGYRYNGIVYTPSDIRLENLCIGKLMKTKKTRLVIFAHEIPFQKYYETQKLKAVLSRLPVDVKFDY